MTLFDAIGLDADDTLWENETFFRVTEAEFCALLSDHGDAETIAARLAASVDAVVAGAVPAERGPPSSATTAVR